MTLDIEFDFITIKPKNIIENAFGKTKYGAYLSVKNIKNNGNKVKAISPSSSHAIKHLNIHSRYYKKLTEALAAIGGTYSLFLGYITIVVNYYLTTSW